MIDLFEELEQRGIQLPAYMEAVLKECKKLSIYNSSHELADVATAAVLGN